MCDNTILEIKTSQSAVLKQAFKKVSKFVAKANIIFLQPNHDTSKTGGIRILEFSENDKISIKLNLDATNFDYFKCDEPKITIDVNLVLLCKSLRAFNDDDSIVLYMNKDNINMLYIKSSSGTARNYEETLVEIPLIEITKSEFPLLQTTFENKIMMSAQKIHSLCKQLGNLELIEITAGGSEIRFKGLNSDVATTRLYKDIDYQGHDTNVTKGIYKLEKLKHLSKCEKMCDFVEIYLKNDFPLTLCIPVANLGKMYVFIDNLDKSN